MEEVVFKLGFDKQGEFRFVMMEDKGILSRQKSKRIEVGKYGEFMEKCEQFSFVEVQNL